MGNTIKEIGMKFAKKQPKQAEYLTEKAPIVDIMKFEPASHGLWNAYEEVTEINGATLTKMDAPLAEMDVSSDLKKVDLEFFGGKISKGEDACKMLGGFPAYLAKKQQPIFRQFGMDAEKRFLYQYMRQYAIKNNGVKGNKTLFDAGGTGNKNYSITAVRFEPGITCGLYNPDGFGQGSMLNYTPMNGGNLHDIGGGVAGYAGRFKSNFGFQMADPRTIGLIANINREGYTEANWKLPTGMMIDDLISSVRGTSSDTFLLMHPDVLSALGKFKEDKLQTNVNDKSYDRTFDMWGKIRIVTSYNFIKGAEQDLAV